MILPVEPDITRETEGCHRPRIRLPPAPRAFAVLRGYDTKERFIG